MYITKTDYLEYLFCRKNLWLKKHKPELFLDIELSDFEKKIIEEGNIADKDARNLFPKGFVIKEHNEESLFETINVLKKEKIIFQGAFKWKNFFVRSDILVYNKKENAYELYEVKAVNKVKNDKKHNHIKDLAFQKIVIENNNIKIYKCGVIHFNKEYQKQGEIDYNQLFLITNVSQDVLDIEEKVKEEMFEMKKYLEDSNEEKGCSCVYQGRSNHCTTFSYSNPEVPEYSVHDINRIGNSPKLIKNWIDKKIYNISDIDDVDKLKGSKKLQYLSYIKKEAIIDKEKIKEKLLSLNFPLQFFDYEGLTCAVPRFNGFSPYDQLPFQYSLHIMHESGEIEHKEFLITENISNITRSLVERMKEDLDEKGTTIAWSTKYEKARNLKLAELHPDKKDFLEKINENMFDLMTIFSNDLYVDYRFKGSSSIKNILPVLIPELSYKNLNISKGDQASEKWEKMMFANLEEKEKEKIKKDLLTYCQLDTWAMVKIYQYLLNVIDF